jgi:twinkle protein
MITLPTYSDLPDVQDYLVCEPRFIDPSSGGLWFCSDALTVQEVQINAVCLHTGGEWSDLVHCTEFFSAFRFVFIVSADPEQRRKMTEEIKGRITGVPILVSQNGAYKGCKSVTELRERYGLAEVEKLLCGAIELPAYGLLDLADVRKPPKAKCTVSGFTELDKETGGFADSEVTVLTGRRGEGKSTLLSQILLSAIDSGRTVCAYSGELPSYRFKEWCTLQAAGDNYLDLRTNKESGKKYFAVPGPIQQLIDEWWKERFFLYDNAISSAHDEDSIISIFEYANRRYGASMFAVDNVMSTRLKGANDSGFYRAQSNFVGRLVAFAKKTGSHVILCAHPRKTEAKKRLDADDISGSGDIANQVDNVLSLERLSEEEKE